MNKYLKAISYNFIFLIVNTLSFLLLTPFALHIMGDDFFGIWSVLYSIMLFSSLGAVGISSIVNKFAAEITTDNKERHDGEIISAAALIIFPLAMLTANALWLMSGLIAEHMHLTPALQSQFAIALQICAIGIFPQFMAKIPQGFMLSQYKNNIVRSLDFAANILPWIGAILICLFERNIIWIALWFVLVQSILCVIYTYLIRKEIIWNLLPGLSIIRRMTNFSFFMFIESTAISMFQLLDRVLVSFVLGPAAAGVYSVGTSVGVRMSLVAGQITEVMIPYASSKDSLGEEKQLFSTFRKMSQYISLIIAGIGSFLIIWMHEILSLWISTEYAEKYTGIFQIIIVAYCLLSLCRPGHQTLTGMGKVKFTALVYLGSAIFMLSTLYFLAHYYGLLGAASANLVMVILLLFNLFAYKLLNERIHWKYLLIDLGWGIVMPLIIYGLILTFPHISIGQKIILTSLLGVGILSAILKDEFFKKSIASIIASNQKV